MPLDSFCKRTRKYPHKSHMHASRKSTRRKKMRGRGLRKFLKGMWSMEEYWRPIQNKLQTLAKKGEFKCVMCKATLPSNFKYKTVMSWFGVSSALAETDENKLIVRKYNLPSAVRMNVNTSRQYGGTIQPTIFYFHCPHCAYLHQFKSSVLEPRNSSRSKRRSRSSRSSNRRESS